MEVLLLHGWAANSRFAWLPYIARELKKKRITVRVPNLPMPKAPLLDQWSYEMVKNVLGMKHPKIVIGHSLGGLTILRTLEETKLPIDLAVIISAPIHVHLGKREFLSKFFKVRYKWSKIRKNIKHVIVLHGKDDPLVDARNAREIAKNLHAKLIITPTGKHYLMKRFPLLRDIILTELKHL